MGTENGSPDSFGKSLATTRVGLGCASLHHLPTHSQRQSLLRCAFEHGIRYFDCARMYGNGLAEREVGVLANDHRSAMIIATKLGIPANATLERFPVLQYPAKITRRLFGFLSPSAATFQENRFCEAEADRNLSASLRALRQTSIDILLLHEPQPHEVEKIRALSEWAYQKRAAGTVQHFGLAGDHASLVGAELSGSPWSEVIQVPIPKDSDVALTTHRLHAHVLYGIFRAANECGTGAAGSDLERSGAKVLRQALLHYPEKTILISTRKIARIELAARVINEIVASNTVLVPIDDH